MSRLLAQKDAPHSGHSRLRVQNFPKFPKGEGPAEAASGSSSRRSLWGVGKHFLQTPRAWRGQGDPWDDMGYCRNDSKAQGAPPGASVLAGMTIAGGHQRRPAITLDH